MRFELVTEIPPWRVSDTPSPPGALEPHRPVSRVTYDAWEADCYAEVGLGGIRRWGMMFSVSALLEAGHGALILRQVTPPTNLSVQEATRPDFDPVEHVLPLDGGILVLSGEEEVSSTPGCCSDLECEDWFGFLDLDPSPEWAWVWNGHETESVGGRVTRDVTDGDGFVDGVDAAPVDPCVH